MYGQYLFATKFDTNTFIGDCDMAINPSPKWRSLPSSILSELVFWASITPVWAISICIPNLLQISSSATKTWPKIQIQYGGRCHLEFYQTPQIGCWCWRDQPAFDSSSRLGDRRWLFNVGSRLFVYSCGVSTRAVTAVACTVETPIAVSGQSRLVWSSSRGVERMNGVAWCVTDDVTPTACEMYGDTLRLANVPVDCKGCLQWSRQCRAKFFCCTMLPHWAQATYANRLLRLTDTRALLLENWVALWDVHTLSWQLSVLAAETSSFMSTSCTLLISWQFSVQNNITLVEVFAE